MSDKGHTLTELRPPFIGIAEGRPSLAGVPQWIIPGLIVAGGQTPAAVTADRMYYHPFYVRTPITIDRLGIEVTAAAAAGKIARLGIYQADLNLQPTTLIVDAGTVLVDANAVVAATVNTYLSPGRYLSAFVSNSTPTIRRFLAQTVGLIAAIGASPSIMDMYKAAVGSGALANPGIQWDTFTTAGTWLQPMILLRVSQP